MPPFEKLPELLNDLYFKYGDYVKQRYGVSSAEFFKNILSYNSLHAMGSNTYNRLQVGMHGVQTVKSQVGL